MEGIQVETGRLKYENNVVYYLISIHIISILVVLDNNFVSI